jgi:hypothetical protein
MIRVLPVAALLSAIVTGPVFAQTSPSSTSTTPPAIATSGVNNTLAAPVAGANSFTMAQAQKRIEERGYTQVTALAKDDKSIWRGQAMKDGKPVAVALDYQGNVTSN